MGIKPNVFFILGFPWEDSKALEITQKHMAELSPYVEEFHPAIASILIPFPGTEIYEKHKHQYGFYNWWLSEDRSFDAPSLETHPYYETILFRNGAVLDANFLDYSVEVQRKIRAVFKFMYAHNIRGMRKVPYLARRLLFSLSEKLSVNFPSLERNGFSALLKLKHALKRPA